ncbi:MAG: hypothetical protein HQL53_01290 [Magnetococcales bacterium]|nr:hypothetical protein [Magnetococcales bacterium]
METISGVIAGFSFERMLRSRWFLLIGKIMTAPVIWSIFIPLALLDLMATLYQSICFPIYGLPLVNRSEYIIIDRHKLSYLDLIEKLNCVYCGYGNGVLSYVQEIAGRTEQYWCPIKHRKESTKDHRYYNGFSEYGDEASYRKEIQDQEVM